MTRIISRKTNKGKKLVREFGLFGRKMYVEKTQIKSGYIALSVFTGLSLGLMFSRPTYDFLSIKPVQVAQAQEKVEVSATQAGQPTPTPSPIRLESELTEKQQILTYIIKKFGDDAHKAIGIIATCENRNLDTHATNRNRNGSVDRGIFQINSIHGGEEMFDWQINIDKAYELYQNRGNKFTDWTCAGVVGQKNYLYQ